MSLPTPGRSPRTVLPLLAAALMLANAGWAQERTYTEPQRMVGERSLVLTGSFQGTDTALVQVYHDGMELSAEPFVRTWALTLGTYEYYVVKFSTSDHRVKRLYIMELGDDMVEFYPPIDVDFDVAGNLVIIKQRTGKANWQEFDVGMSRKRTRQ